VHKHVEIFVYMSGGVQDHGVLGIWMPMKGGSSVCTVQLMVRFHMLPTSLWQPSCTVHRRYVNLYIYVDSAGKKLQFQQVMVPKENIKALGALSFRLVVYVYVEAHARIHSTMYGSCLAFVASRPRCKDVLLGNQGTRRLSAVHGSPTLCVRLPGETALLDPIFECGRACV
jgi:hypothetical protein